MNVGLVLFLGAPLLGVFDKKGSKVAVLKLQRISRSESSP